MDYKPSTLRSPQRVLITGGCGFIGSHVADKLLDTGYHVAILDNLDPQVHPDQALPQWTVAQIERDAQFFRGDINDEHHLDYVIQGFRPHTVVHLAARVGVGQAEYQGSSYLDVNVTGTARVIESIQRANDSIDDETQNLDGCRRIVTAGSMSSYGEGLYRCDDHPQGVRPTRRAEDVLDQWFEPRCPYSLAMPPQCDPDRHLQPRGVQEWRSLNGEGIYARSKAEAEHVTMNARRVGLSTAVLRLFNVMGPRQSLTNPYTGVAAIFAARCLAGLPPRIYEDGGQVRDFVHVSDVARAFQLMCGPPQLRLALRLFMDTQWNAVFNVATGVGTSIKRVAEIACEVLAPELEPEITMQARAADIRSCIGDPFLIDSICGWRASVAAETGLRELFAELATQAAPNRDSLERAHLELEDRRLVLGTNDPTMLVDPHADIESMTADLGDVVNDDGEVVSHIEMKSGWLGADDDMESIDDDHVLASEAEEEEAAGEPG